MKKRKASERLQKLVRRRRKYTAYAIIAALSLTLGYATANRWQNNRIENFLHGRQEMQSLPKDIKTALPTPEPQTTPPVKLAVPILMYHYVEYVSDAKDTLRMRQNIQPFTFEQQVETLADNGYAFVTPSYLVNIIKGKVPAPPKMVILSFDDGYRDFYTDVFPILKKHRAKAVLYVINSFVGLTRNFLTADQLKEINASGLVEIGAHTMDHLWLKNLNPETARREITESRMKLAELLKTSVYSFAYPYGAFDATTVEMVRSAGYTNAVSTVPGKDQGESNLFFLYRIRPGYRWGQELIDYIENVKDTPMAK